MIIDRIKRVLIQRGFIDRKVNVNNIILLCDPKDNEIRILLLIHCPGGNEFTKEQIWNIKRQLNHQFQEQYLAVKMHAVIFTGNVNAVKKVWEEDTQHWIIDTRSLSLIIYEDQRDDYFGTREVIDGELFSIKTENTDKGYQYQPGQNKEHSLYGESEYQEGYTGYDNVDNEYLKENYGYDRTGDAAYNMRTDARDTAARGYGPLKAPVSPMNTIIIILNIIVFLVVENLPLLKGRQTINEGALYWPSIVYGKEYYRVFTYMFLHSGIQHISNNMLILFVIGNNLERVTGKWKYLMIYFGSGLLAGIASMSYNMINNTNVISVGASGAVFGIVGAMAYIVILNKGRMENFGVRQIVLFAVFSLYGGLTSQGVDNAAHIGGILAGILLAAILYRKHKKNKPKGVNI